MNDLTRRALEMANVRIRLRDPSSHGFDLSDAGAVVMPAVVESILDVVEETVRLDIQPLRERLDALERRLK